MKQKALVLGAKPPFAGPWIPIEGNRLWQYSVECNPITADLDGQLSIRIVDSTGAILPLDLTEHKFRGTAVQAQVGEVDGVNAVSIFIEEVEDE